MNANELDMKVSTRIDSKTLKKELPDIAAKYSTITTYRRFLIA